jgi:diadenosine tetraphosphate (Ap4A) HIT family hydrolase
VRIVAHAAAKALDAHGMSIFQNNGAGANHEPHYHVHVVPRFKGSDPHRIFTQPDFEVMSMKEQRAIADLIRSAL